MKSRNSERRSGAKLAILGAALVAVLATPLAGSAALSNGNFVIRAVDQSGEIFGMKGNPTAPEAGGGETTPPAPDLSQVATFKLNTELCTKPGVAFSTTLPPTATVNWGDGSPVVDAMPGVNLHPYETPGTYTVTIKGEVPAFGVINSFDTSACFISMDSWGEKMNTVDASNMFQNMTNLLSVPAKLPATVTSTYSMFNTATKFNQDISGWDMSRVTNTNLMFRGALNFNQDISDWDVSNVTNMASMFRGAQRFNQDISDWDVSKVTNFSSMFESTVDFDQPLAGWDMTSATDLSLMFKTSGSFNQDLSSWSLPNVTTMASMFEAAKAYNTPINWPTTAKVTTLSKMFYGSVLFDKSISMDMSKVTTTQQMFYTAKAFNQDISQWSVPSLRTISQMFYGATLFNQDLSKWQISSTATHSQFVYSSAMQRLSWIECDPKLPHGWRCSQ